MRQYSLILGVSLLLFSCSKKADKISVEQPTKPDTTAEQAIDMTPFSEVFGVTTAGGQYALTDKPILIETAEAIYGMGTKCIKLWFEHAGKKYPYHSNWPANIENFTSLQLAQTDYFKQVFEMPFKVYSLEYNDATVNWKDGFSEAERTKVYNNMYDVTKYLLNTYKNTGKTFIIQNWEGDGFIGIKDLSPAQIPIAEKAMIDFINTRQAAVTQARKDAGTSGVIVVHALEFNFVPPTNTQNHYVIDDIVPYTKCDLYSYSSYSSRAIADLGGIVPRLARIKSKLPKSDIYGTHNLMIGEFGYEERGPFPYDKPITEASGNTQRYSISEQLKYLLDYGVCYIFYWQIYCNGEVDDSGINFLSTEPHDGIMLTAKNLKGYWLIRPDGSKPPVYDYLKDLLQKNELVKAQRPKY
nr:hypothetical protein [uncultured Pedobacter sp.]